MSGLRPGECVRRIAGRYACPTRRWVFSVNGAPPRIPGRRSCGNGPQVPHTAGLLRCGDLPGTLGTLPQTVSCGPGRVNRVDRQDTLVTVTFGTAKLDQTLPVAAPNYTENADLA